jgi:hypothetical protein
MKKLLFIATLICCLSQGVLSQNFVQRTNGTFTPVDPFLSVPRALYIPRSCDTTNALNGGKDTTGALVWDTCNNKLWIRAVQAGLRYWRAANFQDLQGSGAVNQVTIWTGTNTIGGDAGFTVNPSTNTFYTDSMFLNKKLYFTGNSITPNKATAIQLGDRYNPFYTDTTVGSTTGTIMVIYPKYACDTCRYNQPFYMKVGTTDQGLGLPTNSGIQYGFGSGELNRSLAYDQTEQRFFDQVERYFEFKPEGVNDRIRPFAYNCNITGSIIGNVQALHETDQNIYFSHRYADKVYATTGPNAAKFDPYLTATTSAVTSLTHIDSATNSTKGGFSHSTQLAGGFYNSSYTYHGQQINISTPAGFYYNSTGTGLNGSFGRNYIFSVSSGNANNIMWVGKDWGGSFSQAFQVFNNQNTMFGPVNIADFGYKLQAVGSSAAFMAGNITTLNSSVIYPASYIHTLSAGGASVGLGVGYKFEGHNANNTKRDMAAMEAVYTDVVNATEDADIVFRTIRAGTANTEAFRLTSTGAAKFNNAFTFPTTDGTSGQVLQTNGSGVVTWQTRFLTGSGTLDFPNTVAGTSSDLTVTVTGAADGDVVAIGVANGSTVSNGCFTAWVSGSNTVTIRFTNNDLVTAFDPASGTFKATVIK